MPEKMSMQTLEAPEHCSTMDRGNPSATNEMHGFHGHILHFSYPN